MFNKNSLLNIIALALLSFTAILFSSCSSDKKIDPGKIAEYNKPAVVYIET